MRVSSIAGIHPNALAGWLAEWMLGKLPAHESSQPTYSFAHNMLKGTLIEMTELCSPKWPLFISQSALRFAKNAPKPSPAWDGWSGWGAVFQRAVNNSGFSHFFSSVMSRVGHRSFGWSNGKLEKQKERNFHYRQRATAELQRGGVNFRREIEQICTQ